MYIPVERKAKPGEYIEHKKTGQILLARWVDHEGLAIVDEHFHPGHDAPEHEMWGTSDYFVLEKINPIHH
ncbi:hypothetical protein [Cytobacillus luteolus]|uniref:hypothetical protein n=1 Tax=Litchfieldia luteola TaxID=682179 RepID=UPI001AEA3AE4|nr:hypothetical protein [Cytobacillus luteolus]MBP1944644.1 hypothetical protein [Cytobacillus luteolus]